LILPVLRNTQEKVGPVQLRFQRKCFLKTFHRLFVPALTRLDQAEIEVCFGKSGILLDGVRKARRGGVQLPGAHRLRRLAESFVSGGRILSSVLRCVGSCHR